MFLPCIVVVVNFLPCIDLTIGSRQSFIEITMWQHMDLHQHHFCKGELLQVSSKPHMIVFHARLMHLDAA